MFCRSEKPIQPHWHSDDKASKTRNVDSLSLFSYRYLLWIWLCFGGTGGFIFNGTGCFVFLVISKLEISTGGGHFQKAIHVWIFILNSIDEPLFCMWDWIVRFDVAVPNDYNISTRFIVFGLFPTDNLLYFVWCFVFKT